MQVRWQSYRRLTLLARFVSFRRGTRVSMYRMFVFLLILVQMRLRRMIAAGIDTANKR